jgi:hypothetical protein
MEIQCHLAVVTEGNTQQSVNMLYGTQTYSTRKRSWQRVAMFLQVGSHEAANHCHQL